MLQSRTVLRISVISFRIHLLLNETHSGLLKTEYKYAKSPRSGTGYAANLYIRRPSRGRTVNSLPPKSAWLSIVMSLSTFANPYPQYRLASPASLTQFKDFKQAVDYYQVALFMTSMIWASDGPIVS